MSLCYNLVVRTGVVGLLKPPGALVHAAQRHKGGLLISPEVSIVTEQSRRSARQIMLWLGIGLILSVFALITSLISLALS
ncbi:MAG: hypothetical protein INF79_16710 [Roseomonas sp.]|nr:hypothetical protein [Roseomonas sp.]MCA3328946.1 hypothetical protein [Roseomonas sp.]MCA3331216.1 hypothetical protein [Roseomonas sp.]MCA3334786.1 hypothetical protein [Roseomonas sp.]MCA3347892.1 hypothetical protein [Roseomonas sp.]